jgi:hypothetical protein
MHPDAGLLISQGQGGVISDPLKLEQRFSLRQNIISMKDDFGYLFLFWGEMKVTA